MERQVCIITYLKPNFKELVFWADYNKLSYNILKKKNWIKKCKRQNKLKKDLKAFSSPYVSLKASSVSGGFTVRD